MRYWEINLSRKFIGKGDGNIGYAIEKWWVLMFIEIRLLRPNGIRGIVK